MTKDDTQLTLEHRLCRLAERVKKKVGQKSDAESECAIYLYDFRRDMYVLRASTKPSRYLGIDELMISGDARKHHRDGNRNRIGLTVSTILDNKPKIYNNILNCEEYSCFKMRPHDIEKWEQTHYCEFANDELWSFLGVPISFSEVSEDKPAEPPQGVIRVVRNKNKEDQGVDFSGANAKKLESLLKGELNWIQSGAFLSQLIEIGTYTNVRSLCEKAAVVFRNLLMAKGCSIFLLDETHKPGRSRDVNFYRCYGTTGLVTRDKADNFNEIKDPFEKGYEFDKKHVQGSLTPPEMSFTMGVVRARTCAFIDNIYDPASIENVFPRMWMIKREPGIGQLSERFVIDGSYQEAQSVLFAPMFYCEPRNKKVDVLGVVRIVRHRGVEPFTSEQKHLFVSLVERLSKAIVTARLMRFMDNLSTIGDKKKLFTYVVANIPKYIGATDCAILQVRNGKLITVASWEKGETCYEPDNKVVYDLNDPDEKGYTFYVAKYGKPLMFNSKQDLKRQFSDESVMPQHYPKSSPEPHRFIGVPMRLSSGKVGAVLRICKDDQSIRITQEDRQVLERIANQLRSRIEEFNQLESRRLEIRSFIPENLQRHIGKLSIITCRHLLNNFILELPHCDNIEDRIIEFAQKLWKFYKPDFERQPISIIEKFELFNEKILSRVPLYRDHFVHQFVVFLIGAIIIDRLKCAELIRKAYPGYQNGADTEAEKAWVFTSLFHDVAYPLETVDKWFWTIIEEFVTDSAMTRQTKIPVDDILYDPDYMDCIDKLERFHTEDLKRDEYDLRRTIMGILRNTQKDFAGLDHGIMGALILLSNTRFEFEHVAPCASAIALHNALGEMPNIDKIIFERHPLAFLLIYCDLLHEWGRDIFPKLGEMSSKYPLLEELVVVDTWKELNHYGISEDRLRSILSELEDDRKCILGSIQVDTAVHAKLEEARRKFAKLRSCKYYFFVKINNELFVAKDAKLYFT